MDVAEFERAISERLPILRASMHLNSELAMRLKEILALYQGDFLEGFYLREGHGLEEWIALTRERLRRLAHIGFRQLVANSLETGAYLSGIEFARRLVAIDPFDEEARRQTMWLYIRSGQKNNALREYEALRKLLADELGVAPAPATTALVERFRAVSIPISLNLPPDSTPFLGRETEIAQLREMLCFPSTRLITLFGPGGMGKTRLAIEVARRLAQQQPGLFLDGIFFVSLNQIDSRFHIPTAIAEAIGMGLEGDILVAQQVLAYLKNKEILLILDDCEKFITPSFPKLPLLASILKKTPEVKLLVTSRERLKMVQEFVFDVPGLDIPAQDTVDPEASSAIALFIQTAQRIQRNFAPSAEETQAIVQVCRLLYGVPLAIELAASWARQYSAAEIAKKVENSLDFLQANFRDIPERHRSLRAVFDHAWKLLAPPEQGIFCQLTFFEGGFTREAADSVVSLQSAVISEEITEHRTLITDHRTEETENWILTTDHWLASFTDKSLLQFQPDGRYTLHPLLRQFATEKRTKFVGLEVATRQRHADHYLNFVARQGSGEEPEHRLALKTEFANIRLAWDHAVDHHNFIALEWAIPVMHNFYSIQSWFQEGVSIFEIAEESLSRVAQTPEQLSVLCDLLGRTARIYVYIGRIEDATIALKKAQTYLEKIDSPSLRSKILDTLAITYFYAGEYTQAEAVADEILAYSTESDNQEGVAFALNFLGSCAKAVGSYRRASDFFELAVSAYRVLKDELGVAMVLNNLGNLALADNDFQMARKYYQESGQLFSELDHVHGLATTLTNEGKLALREGHYAEARRLLTESLELKKKMNDQRAMAIALSSLGDLFAETGEATSARQHLSQALSLAKTSGDIRLVIEILVAVASFWLKEGSSGWAARLFAYTWHHPALTQEVRDRIKSTAQKGQLAFVGKKRLEKVVEEVLKGLGEGN